DLTKELDLKNRKFRDKCILIAQILLDEEPLIDYQPSFLQGLELDAFFPKHQITLEAS
ncbi:20138_t:CDS:1, partial [Rhizophagus irregularis]